MTSALDPGSAIDPASLPGDPAGYRPKKTRNLVVLVVGLVFLWVMSCVIAGLTARYWLPAPPTGKAAAPSVPGLFAKPAVPAPRPAAAAPPIGPAPALAAPADASAAAAALEARITRLEDGQRDAAGAAAAALAAGSLAEAAQSSTRFDGELTAVIHLLPVGVDLAGLQRTAGQGAPTRMALAAEFSALASRAAAAGHVDADGDGMLTRARNALARIIVVRRVGPSSGKGVDATLARAQVLIEDGDLERALVELDQLPAGSQKALAAWRVRAQRRVDIDRQVAAIRAAALADLARSQQARP